MYLKLDGSEHSRFRPMKLRTTYGHALRLRRLVGHDLNEAQVCVLLRAHTEKVLTLTPSTLPMVAQSNQCEAVATGRSRGPGRKEEFSEQLQGKLATVQG